MALIIGPIHYDFLLPLTPETHDALAPLAPHHPTLSDPRARWQLVGWGAREFYTTVGYYSDVSLKALWRGVTGDASVMRVDVLGPIDPNYPLKKVSLTPAQYSALLAQIEQSFARWHPMDADGFGETDRFYPAKGTFHLGRTCNVWVGDMLRAAGVRFGIWTPIPASVSRSHWLYAE